MRRLTLFALLATTIACGSSSPTAPTAPTPPPPPAIPACQSQHTASATFQNRGNSTIDVVLDGGVLGSLAPQASGLTRTIASGVAHSVVFQLTNTRVSLCANFNPIPVECGTPIYQSCTY